MFYFRKKVYLDNNATTPVAAEVRRRMDRVLAMNFGNPSSLYLESRDSAAVLEEARKTVAAAVNAAPEEIIFTGSATEANNQVLVSLFERFYPAKDTVVSSPVEHPAVLATLEYLKKRGAKVKYCRVDRKGLVSADELISLIDTKTFLVVLMLANNEAGTIQPVRETAELCRVQGVLFLSDCVQALGKIPVDVKALGVDYATFSGHKVHGPKGVGALYVKRGSPIGPFIHGGHQEGGLRAGTEGLHNIAGMACAFGLAARMLEKAPKVRKMKESLSAGIRKLVPGCSFNSPETQGLPNTLSVTFPGMNNAQLMAYLDTYGIAVSAGSACNTQSNEPSHVLTAIGLTEEQARETIRLSLSDKTKDSDIRYFLKVLGFYIDGGAEGIGLVNPAQLDEKMLSNPNLYILDVRFGTDRKLLKGISGSHEVPFPNFSCHLTSIPKDKDILVVCQAGGNAPMAAYNLRSRGYKNVSFLISGLAAWRVLRPDLYQKYSGKNIHPV